DGNGRVLQPLPVLRPDQLGLLCVNSQSASLAGLPWWALRQNGWAKRVEEQGGQPPQIWAIPPERSAQTELPPARWRDFKKVSGVLLASMPQDERAALYPHCGDWLPRGCWLVLAGCVALRRRRIT